MHRLYPLALLVLLSTPAYCAQRIWGYCSQGGVQGSVQFTSSVVTPKFQASYPGCTVKVFLPGTTTLAPIYAGQDLTPKSNPFTADAKTGYWEFYGVVGGLMATSYDVNLSGAGIATPFTLADVGITLDDLGGGTVRSVGLTLPINTFTSPVPGSPITTSGTLVGSFINQPINTFLAGPYTGAPATPTWRKIQSFDLPIMTSTLNGAGRPDNTSTIVDVTGKFSATFSANVALPSNGCDPTGATNSYTCLQNWLNMGGKMYLPPGTYVFCPGLVEPNSNVEIFGAGAGASVLKAQDNCQMNTMLDIGNHVGGGSGVTNVYVHDLTLDNNSQGTHLGTATGVSSYNSGATYYADGFLKGVGGGGPDTVLDSNSCSVSTPCTVYKALQNPVPVSTPPPNAAYWAAIQTGITANGNGLGIGLTGVHMKLQHIEIDNGQIGIFLYSGGDISLSESYVHDMGVLCTGSCAGNPYMGNNVTLAALITASGTSSVFIHHNTTFNIYAGTYGPGASVSYGIASDNLVVDGNTAINVVNNGGGSLVGTFSVTASDWVISNNVVDRTIGAVNHDQTNCIEVEASYLSITGNSCHGFDSGISVSGNGFVPSQQFYGSVTGNTIVGTGCSISGHPVPFCYGVFLFGNYPAHTAQANYNVVEGNSISFENNAVVIDQNAVGNIVGTNVYNGNVYNVTDPGRTSLYVPSIQTGTISVDTVLPLHTVVLSFSNKTIPVLQNGQAGDSIAPGTIYKVHAVIFLQNTSGTTGYIMAPEVYFGNPAGAFVHFSPGSPITLAPNTTFGILNIDVECNVNTVAASGGIICDGTGNFDGSNVGTNQTIGWLKAINGFPTNAYTPADTFGMDFFPQTNNTTVSAQVYDARFEVIQPKNIIP